ncbi:MAG: DUF362 domain-containing protein [Acidobacteriota bacterium]
MTSKARVAVVKTRPDSVLEDIGRTMDLGEAKSYLDPAATTILKDNISWHFPYPGANTTPWQLEGTIQKLRADGYDDLVCVQNNTVVTDPKKGERLNRYLPVLDQYKVPVRYNCFADDLKWERYEPQGKMLVLPKIYPDGITIPEFFHGKNIVHLPTVKCHIYTTTTGAMKNAFGGLLNTRRHYTHSYIHETLVDLLTIQKEIHSGLFCVKDGTTCGNGPGPRTMIPEEKNILLASGDQVAIDAVAAKIMGFDPMSIKYIRLAHEAGLGCGDPRDIEVVGEDISGWNYRFSVGDNMISRFGDLVWFGPLKGIQKLLFRTPLLYFFVFGSAFYHDYAWYPTVGKKRIEHYKKNSQWMKLFDTYPEADEKRSVA